MSETTPANEKAGWCSMCISDMHSMCASPKCQCPNVGRRNHSARPGEVRKDATVTRIEKARNASPPADKDKPVFRLVKEAPPRATQEARAVRSPTAPARRDRRRRLVLGGRVPNESGGGRHGR